MDLAGVDGMLLKTQAVIRNLFQTGGLPFTLKAGQATLLQNTPDDCVKHMRLNEGPANAPVPYSLSSLRSGRISKGGGENRPNAPDVSRDGSVAEK